MLFGRTNYNRPTRFINEISSDLLDYQGLARPANTSFKASYSSGGIAFGQGMSLAQALQERKRNAAPSSIQSSGLPFGQFTSGNKKIQAIPTGLLGILLSTRSGERERSLKFQVAVILRN
ncbi:hypothetical protein HMPREF9950_0738 [Streptococcus oralis SK313]|uniref:Uncharacterized protein n=1 Tax=Streptococcus oralis SK313 TaxID=1035190 RepID=F9Q118_STROR|nr:hypothetical protein HMPREF9950_0738 [Streptococcus oralis SK313]